MSKMTKAPAGRLVRQGEVAEFLFGVSTPATRRRVERLGDIGKIRYVRTGDERSVRLYLWASVEAFLDAIENPSV